MTFHDIEKAISRIHPVFFVSIWNIHLDPGIWLFIFCSYFFIVISVFILYLSSYFCFLTLIFQVLFPTYSARTEVTLQFSQDSFHPEFFSARPLTVC